MGLVHPSRSCLHPAAGSPLPALPHDLHQWREGGWWSSSTRTLPLLLLSTPLPTYPACICHQHPNSQPGLQWGPQGAPEPSCKVCGFMGQGQIQGGNRRVAVTSSTQKRRVPACVQG